MNTDRSKKLATEFLNSGDKLLRKSQKVAQKFSHPPKVVFEQLCPSRELDWIRGWQCDLTYTYTGYAEADCIFTTPQSNIFGPGLWIFTNYVIDRELSFVVLNDSTVEHVTIRLEDHQDGSCTGVWDLTFTALNQEGNQMLATLGDDNPELKRVTEGLEYYLNHGEMMPASDLA